MSKKKEKVNIPSAGKVLADTKEVTLFNELVDNNRFGQFSISFSMMENYLAIILPLVFSETFIVKADMDMKNKVFNYIGYNKLFEKVDINNKKINKYKIKFENTKKDGLKIKAEKISDV